MLALLPQQGTFVMDLLSALFTSQRRVTLSQEITRSPSVTVPSRLDVVFSFRSKWNFFVPDGPLHRWIIKNPWPPFTRKPFFHQMTFAERSVLNSVSRVSCVKCSPRVFAIKRGSGQKATARSHAVTDTQPFAARSFQEAIGNTACSVLFTAPTPLVNIDDDQWNAFVSLDYLIIDIIFGWVSSWSHRASVFVIHPQIIQEYIKLSNTALHIMFHDEHWHLLV